MTSVATSVTFSVPKRVGEIEQNMVGGGFLASVYETGILEKSKKSGNQGLLFKNCMKIKN